MCGIPYNMKKYQIVSTNEFEEWFDDQQTKVKGQILARLDLLTLGHFGDHKRFGGLIELRWKNGMRVYSFLWGSTIVVALNGGNKHAQNKDIQKAKKIINEIFEGIRPIYK